jgi:CRISPR-associated protein Cas2
MQAFVLHPNASERAGHRCGQHQMLTLIAYDITDHKRLARIAKVCEDWGVRVQYSVFECRLEATAFDRFWDTLQAHIDQKEDRLVAYPVCLRCARDIRTAGTMVTSEKVVAYVC